MVANILTYDTITVEPLMYLENTSVMLQKMFRGFESKHFDNANPKEGESFRARLPNRYVAIDGPIFDDQGLTERYVTLTVNYWKHVPLSLTEDNLKMEINDFATTFSNPAARTLKTQIDLTSLGLYKDIYNQVGTAGTTPSTIAVINKAARVLDDNAVPRDDGMRTGVIDPSMNEEMTNSMTVLYNPQEIITKQFRTGRLAADLGSFIQVDMSQNVNTHTTGNFGLESSGTPHTAIVKTFVEIAAIKNANAKQANVVNLPNPQVLAMDEFSNDAVSPYPSLKKGDVFTMSDVYKVNDDNKQNVGYLQQFVCTEDCVWDAGNSQVVVPFAPEMVIDGPYQNVTALPTAGAVVTFTNDAEPNSTYAMNMFFHKDAFAFCGISLFTPASGKSSVRTYKGNYMRTWTTSNFNDSTHSTRIDNRAAINTIRPEMAVRVIGQKMTA